jgi:GNAT superfamily N-acetyltransferase
MDILAVRGAYDSQVRRSTRTAEPGAVVEADVGVVRNVAPGAGTSCIVWSKLTAESADAVIAAQRDHFTARGTPLEWKYYDYDQPADLPARLVAAGFVPDDEELMLIAETAAVQAEIVLPEGVRLVPVSDAAGVDALIGVRDAAFGGGSPDFRDRMLAALETPDLVQVVVAFAGAEPVSAARIEFVEGTDFAGLWGGGTVPAWRGRGIFRALVAYRAGLASARGYRYLQVDALPASRPILERLGFEPVAGTTPYLWTPADHTAAGNGLAGRGQK